MSAILNQEAWLRIIDFLMRNINYYQKVETATYSMTNLPVSVVENALQNQEEGIDPIALYSIYFPWETGMVHHLYIIRLICKATKCAVDKHNRMYKRFMHVGLDPISPWSYWNSRNNIKPADWRILHNPYRRLDRKPENEENFKLWNNRENKHKIRIMWKEYIQEWKPWFTDENSWYKNNPCKEERQAYNVFRYNLTEEEFRARWS